MEGVKEPPAIVAESTIADLLKSVEWLTIFIFDLLSSRQFATSRVLQRISSAATVDAKLDYETRQPFETRNGIVSLFQRITAIHPDFHSEVQSVTGHVDKDTEVATAWVVLDCTGTVDGLRREAFCELKWELQNKVWMCTSYQGNCVVHMVLP